MSTLPWDPTIDRRIRQMQKDGYLVVGHNHAWTLTEKGWRTLCAAAEPPIRRPSPDPKLPPMELPQWQKF
jgi:hypothetical protein